jgi:hypothetical protein
VRPADQHEPRRLPTPLPKWATWMGWACVAGCAIFSAAVASEIMEVGDRDVVGGFTDYFLPSPQAVSMLLWEFSLIWVFVVGILVLRTKRRGMVLRTRDVVLAGSLLAGFVLGRTLVGMSSKRVSLGIPGVDH